jgi:hypothetical protein
VVEFVGTMMDVTERRRAEEERQALAHANRITTMGRASAATRSAPERFLRVWTSSPTPGAASARHTAAPIPLAAPVTRTTRFIRHTTLCGRSRHNSASASVSICNVA